MSIRQSLIAGYQLAKRKKRDFSKRELETMFPRLATAEIDAMANGIDDALAGDDFRYRIAILGGTAPDWLLSIQGELWNQ